LHYIVETSSELADPAWNGTGADVEEISAIPNDDTITEDCIVRILPSVGSAPHKFVRLRVLAD
jgi:hypothetical protein